MASNLFLSFLFSTARLNQTPTQRQGTLPTVFPAFVPEPISVDPIPIDPNSFIIPNENPGFNPQKRVPLSFEFRPSVRPPIRRPAPGETDFLKCIENNSGLII